MNNWTLNDSLPLSVTQEFAAPASEQTWLLQDSVPVTLAQQFAPPSSPWSLNYYGGPLNMLFVPGVTETYPLPSGKINTLIRM